MIDMPNELDRWLLVRPEDANEVDYVTAEQRRASAAADPYYSGT